MNSFMKPSLACVAAVITLGSAHFSPAPQHEAFAQEALVDPPQDEVGPAGYLSKATLLTYHRVTTSPAWRRVILGVGHADVMMDWRRFFSSLRYWTSAWLSTGAWTVMQEADLKEPVALSGNSSVLIEGSCLADITIPDNALIHILGDLKAKITVGDHSEIVIGGSVSENGSIEGASICSVYVHGDMDGSISNVGHSWIEGDARGVIVTGTPATRVYVRGNFLGLISPGEKALLSISVDGYMPSEKLFAIADLGYTEFNASIGLSDTTAGVYPTLTDIYDPTKNRQSSQWVVLETAPVEYVNQLKESQNR